MFLIADHRAALFEKAKGGTGEIVAAPKPPEFREYRPSKQMQEASERARKFHTEIQSLVR